MTVMQNLRPLGNSLDIVLKLNGVRFNWRTTEFSEKRFPAGDQIGVVAQDVERVMPEVVSRLSDGSKSVDYSRMVALLIESVKELKAENDSLKQRVETLENAEAS